MSSRQLCSLVIEIVLSAVSLVFFLCVLFPGFLLISIPLSLWRFLLVGYVKLFRPDIVKIMSGKSPVLAIDNLHVRPLCTIVGFGAFECTDVEQCKIFAQNSVYAADPTTGNVHHPEARMYYEEWLGYMWWKQEENFDLSEHIIVWEESKTKILSEDDLINIVEILEEKPFARGKSPWECILIGNVKLNGVKNPDIPKTIVMFRFHHGLADGIAILTVFMRAVFSDSFDKVSKPVYVERSAFQKRMYELGAALQTPYHFFKQGIDAMDVNAWHLPEKQLTRKIHKAWSSRISVSLIKEIKMKHKVGFTAVLVAAVSGAIRAMMIRCKVPVPHKIHAILPLPWPGHPNKLINHWSYGFMELPVGAPDFNKRLNKLHTYIENMKRSAIPAVNFAILKFANFLPTWIIRRIIVTNYLPTIILSNFPGPPSDSEGVGGFPLVDTMFTGGPLNGSIGISITILSYDGGLRIVAGVDSAILQTKEMTKELVSLIEQELHNMRDGASELIV